MDPKSFDQLLARFDSLAAKLGETGSHFWNVIVRQQYIYGYTEVTISVLLLLIFLVGLFFTVKYWEDISDTPGCVFIPLGLVVVFATFLGLFADGIQYFLNPQYWALHDLIDMIPK
jgi:hypothetical protein